MKKMKKERIREIIKNTPDLVEFYYGNRYGNVDVYYYPEEEKTKYLLFFEGKDILVDSLDEAMTTPFIDGKSFNEIAKELKFYYCCERLY